MKATIKFPPKPEATVTLTMTERQAKLLGHLVGRLSGQKAYNLLEQDISNGLVTDSYDLAKNLVQPLYEALRNASPE